MIWAMFVQMLVQLRIWSWLPPGRPGCPIKGGRNAKAAPPFADHPTPPTWPSVRSPPDPPRPWNALHDSPFRCAANCKKIDMIGEWVNMSKHQLGKSCLYGLMLVDLSRHLARRSKVDTSVMAEENCLPSGFVIVPKIWTSAEPVVPCRAICAMGPWDANLV